MIIGQLSQFQKDNKILVSCLASYLSGKIIPKGFSRLQESCKKFGVQLTVLGWDHNFQNMYNSKLQFVGDCLWEKRDEYKYVINLDASDTLFLRPLDELDLDFFSDNMTFCAERNCFPIEGLRTRYPDIGSTYKFLNAGGFVSDLSIANLQFAYLKNKRILATHLAPDEYHGDINIYTDDQAAWSHKYVTDLEKSKPKFMEIDSFCYFFQSLWGVERRKDISTFKGNLMNLEHGTRPFVLHANGSAEYESIYQSIVR